MNDLKRTSHDTYSTAEIDQIAMRGGETVVAAPGVTVQYDVEAYERIDRREVAFGAHRRYEPQRRPRRSRIPRLPKQCIASDGYIVRLGGFRRNNMQGPDECAAALRRAGIRYADSVGNGLFEHLMLCRKYGIVPVFEAPALEIPLPFLASEMPAFKRIYRTHLLEMRNWIGRIEAIYGRPILHQKGQPWVVWMRVSPLALFLMSAARKPEQTAAALRAASAVSRLTPNPKTHEECAGQAKAWAFVRRQHMLVHKIMTDLVREVVASDGVIIGNLHTLPPVDYELMGEAFDHPGLAVRPMYMREPSFREPYIGYAVRLFNDLSGKAPIVSIRANITAAGTRDVCSKHAIDAWHDEALRHGAAGFYVWPIDYPNSPNQYAGPMQGNPDSSALGPERWDAMLGVYGRIADCRRFVTPDADVAVLAAADVLSQSDWKRVMGSYIELEESRIWARLISGRMVERDGGMLDALRVLVIPALPYASDKLLRNIQRYVQNGGTVVLPDYGVGSRDTDGHHRPENLFGIGKTTGKPDEPSAGAGRVVVLRSPACGRTLDEKNPSSAMKAAIRQWRAVARRARIQDRSCVFDITSRNLPTATGKLKMARGPRPEPQLNLRHYLYEHSSNWILPYLSNPTDFPSS